MIRFGSVCSGIEAASVAWTPLGWKADWVAEVDKAASAVLAYRLPDVPNLGDMTTIAARIRTREIPAPDVLVGGTPCQGMSVAGLRGGMADDRTQLTLHFCDIANAIDEVRIEDGLEPVINLRKYQVYRIRLNVPEYEATVSELEIPDNPLYRGYIGITKRHFFRRFKEHRSAAATAKSTTLYRTWNYLKSNQVLHYPALQLVSSVHTLNEAYDLEEKLVAAKTLTTLGLNTIPGGRAGIRMLHELRLLNSTHGVTISDRDKAAMRLEFADRWSPCAHFRSGHLRRLPTGQLTWVKPCWVNPTVPETTAA